MLQALDALLYMHTRSPRVLHRDFKPANILLDASLHAFLGDTGFAKASQRSGEASQLRRSTTARVMGSPGYAHKDVLKGQYSEFTEGYAVGVTLLVVLTRREPDDIEEEIENDHDDRPFEEIPAAELAEQGAGWPAEVASEIKRLYNGLSLSSLRKKNQLKLPDVQRALRALLHASSSGEAHSPDDGQPTPRPAASSVEPSALSLQVRGMRRAGAPEESLLRNVSEAFDSCIWSHAAGSLLIEEAGGMVTDTFGNVLDFTACRDTVMFPAQVVGVFATNRDVHKEVLRQSGLASLEAAAK